MNKLFKVMLILLIPCFAFAQDTKLIGHTDCNSDGDFANWKCVQWEADRSGYANYFRVDVVKTETPDRVFDVGYAVYSDNNNRPYMLIGSDCYADFIVDEFRQFYFSFDHPPYINGGSRYWLCWFDNSNSTLQIERCNSTHPDNDHLKIGSKIYHGVCNPPGIDEFNVQYSNGAYSFSLWTTATVTTTTSLGANDCVADFDKDCNVDGGDAFIFKTEFGRMDCCQ